MKKIPLSLSVYLSLLVMMPLARGRATHTCIYTHTQGFYSISNIFHPAAPLAPQHIYTTSNTYMMKPGEALRADIYMSMHIQYVLYVVCVFFVLSRGVHQECIADQYL